MENKRSSAPVAVVVLMLLLLPVLYALSIGPYALIYNDTEDPPWAYTLYAPLIWSEPTRRVVLAYARLWVEETHEPYFLLRFES